ncbi:hypothetical protein LSCM1_02192 [Leishmania martiniquensis]|uniref:Uncharacterized protein n=1 Tax=Leishmania martiniquensis TaxID=1580590 RepID=A0A836KEU6_9TRYP|nr:hypothetical protein LSCM1_02192 [Leishmania martiniquensis]
METNSLRSALKGARNRAAPAANKMKGQPPDAKPLPAISGPSNANSSFQLNQRGGNRVRAASSARSSSPSSRPLSSQRRGKRQPSSSPSPMHLRNKKGRGRSATVVSQITVDALASINHSLFTQPNLTAKQLRSRLLKEYLQAHSAGARKIEDLWAAERQNAWQSFLEASYTPLSQEIQRLIDYVTLLESTCQQKLQHAHTVTRCSLGGIQRLVQRIADIGTHIRKGTNVLAEKPGVLLSPTGAVEWYPCGGKPGGAASPDMQERGHPAREVCGLDSALSDPHPPAFYISQVDRDERERLDQLFSGVLNSIGASTNESSVGDLAFSTSHTPLGTSGSPAPPTTARLPATLHTRDEGAMPLMGRPSTFPTSSRTPPPHDDPESANEALKESSLGDLQAERTQYSQELQNKLDALGAAFVQLMNRVLVQHQHFKDKITAQQLALDAQATRLKLADDVLRDSVEQGLIESLSAVAAAQQLSLELRERMSVSESCVKAALKELIDQSAEICLDNGALKEYDSLAIKKESCLGTFLTRMERQAVEQAHVLQKAQDGVMNIWRMREKRQLPHSRGASGEEAEARLRGSEAAAGKGEPLPPPYEARLNECDRATLLTFLKRLTRNCPEAATHMTAALDEHDAYCATHPREAAAAREEVARTAAVVQLLQKLDEEARLHCNPHHTSEALSVRIRRLVTQYDAYIDFNQAYARALVRQADAERRMYAPGTVAFFDSRRPVLGQESGLSGRRVPPEQVQRHGKGDRGADASSLPAALSSTAELKTHMPALSAMPYLKLWAHKQQERRHRQCETGITTSGADCHTVGRVVGYLERHPAPLTASADAEAVAAHAAGLLESEPSPPRSRLRRAISASASTSASASLPHPPVPPRKGLASYVISTYGSAAENTDAGVGIPSQPHAEHTRITQKSKAHVSSRPGDHQVIQRAREILLQQD